MRAGPLPRDLPLALLRLGRRFPATILVATALAWVAIGLTATRVPVETDVLSLVPRDNAVMQEYARTAERFGSVDTVLVVIRLEPGADLEPVLEFADHLAASLRAWELVDWVEYRLEDPTAAAAPLLDRATLFLDPEQLEALLTRLRAPDLGGEAERLRAQLLAPQSVVTKDLLRVDPLGLLPRVLERVRLGGVGARLDPATGCLVDPRRSMLLMLAKPTRPAPDLRFDQQLAAGMAERVRQAEADWRAAGWEGEPPRVELTGSHFVTLEDSSLIRRDVVLNLTSSLVGVMLLFALAFRRPAALVFAFVPLFTGLALTLAFAAVGLGRLNTLTASSGALLIGLGIDFVTVLYGRYIEARDSGLDHDRAVDQIGAGSGPPILIGAVTTAATFYAFLVTDFRGLWELGLLTGTGILLVMAAVFLLLPPLLGLGRRRACGRGPRLYLHSFGSDLLCRLCLRHRWPTVVVAAAVTVALGFSMRGLEFDDDIRNMRSAGNRAVALRDEVMTAFGMRFSPMMVRVDGASEGEAVEAARELVPELEALVEAEVLASVDTVATVVPPLEQQRQVIARLASARADFAGLTDRLEAALRGAGLSPEAFRAGLEHTRRAFEVTAPMSVADLAGTPLERMVSRYLAHHDGGVSTAVYCYPPAEKWRRTVPPQLAELVRRHPGTALVGTNVISAELRRIVWKDSVRATLFGLVLVAGLLWADLRSWRAAVLALLPTALGLVWMLGAMAALGLAVNFLNIFVITMLVGIGIDYGVHLLHRWEEEGGAPEAVGETAKAIAVAALTTVVGFGSLVTSHFPGLRSVGGAAILGVGAAALLSVSLLPVLLSWLRPRLGPGGATGGEGRCDGS